MTGYIDNIDEKTINNDYFREVVFTGKYCQLVVMCLKPGEEIGSEVHKNVDQFFRIEKGKGKVVINVRRINLQMVLALLFLAGSEHNVINISTSNDLKLYTIYSPPQHKNGVIHKTKEDAMADETDHL